MADMMVLLTSLMAGWMSTFWSSTTGIFGSALEALLHAYSLSSWALSLAGAVLNIQLRLFLVPCKWALAIVTITVHRLQQGFCVAVKLHNTCWWCAGVAAQAAWPLLRWGGCMQLYGMFVMLRCLGGAPPSVDEASALLNLLVPTSMTIFDNMVVDQAKTPAPIKIGRRSSGRIDSPAMTDSSTNTMISSTTSAPSTPTGMRAALQSLPSASTSAASSRRTSGSSTTSSSSSDRAHLNNKPNNVSECSSDLLENISDKPEDVYIYTSRVCLVGRAALAVAAGFNSKGCYIAPYSPGAAAVAEAAKETARAAVWRALLSSVFAL